MIKNVQFSDNAIVLLYYKRFQGGVSVILYSFSLRCPIFLSSMGGTSCVQRIGVDNVTVCRILPYFAWVDNFKCYEACLRPYRIPDFGVSWAYPYPPGVHSNNGADMLPVYSFHWVTCPYPGSKFRKRRVTHSESRER